MLREFFKQRFLRGLVRRLNNLRISTQAWKVARCAPVPKGAPVVFFKASTGIDDLSWNSGFHLLASWALRLQGVPVVYFACRAGMGHCVLGTNRDNPRKPPPCKSCIYQSETLYAGAPTFKRDNVQTLLSSVEWFTFTEDQELASAIENATLGELMVFQWQDMPLGPLCLPGLRWILRRHHLADDEPTRYLLREYILSAWNVADRFAALLEASNPQSLVANP